MYFTQQRAKFNLKLHYFYFNPIFSSKKPLFLLFDRPFSLNNHIFSRGLIFRHICQLWFLSIVQWTENVILHGCIKVQYKSVKAFFKPDKTLPKSWAWHWHCTRNFFIHFAPFLRSIRVIPTRGRLMWKWNQWFYSDSIFTWVPFQKFWNRWFPKIRIGIEPLIPFSHEPAPSRNDPNRS